MAIEFERRAEGEMTLLDTSILIPYHELIIHLSNKLRGFGKLSHELLEEKVQEIIKINGLASSENLIVIKEVIEELSYGLSKIHQSINYFKTIKNKEKKARYSPKLDTLQSYADETYKLIKKIDTKALKIGFFNEEKNYYSLLNQLFKRDYESLFSKLNKKESEFLKELYLKKANLTKVSEKDYRGKFKVDFNDYCSSLHLSLACSKTIKIQSIKDAMNNGRFPSGIILNTDSKIAATAFTLSYSFPVLVMTKDRGIRKLIERMETSAYEEKVRDFYGLKPRPKNSISISNSSCLN